MLPRILKIIELPFGVQNIKIDLLPSEIQEITIKKRSVLPQRQFPYPHRGYVSPPKKDTVIYNSPVFILHRGIATMWDVD